MATTDSGEIVLAAITIQRWYRKRRDVIRFQVDEFLGSNSPKSGLDLFFYGLKLHIVYTDKEDEGRFHQFCVAILTSMESTHIKTWYVSVAFNKEYSVEWIKQVKWILLLACKKLKRLKPGMPKDDQLIQTFLTIFVLLTDYTLWKLSEKGGDSLKPTLHKMCSSFIEHLMENNLFLFLRELLLNGLCHPRPRLNKHALPAAMGLRAMALCSFSGKSLTLFISQILTVPACIWHLHELSPEALSNLLKFDLVTRCTQLLKNFVLNDILQTKDRTERLALFGNLLQLNSFQVMEPLGDQDKLCTLAIFMDLLKSLKAERRESATANWHLVFGWTCKSGDNRLLDCLPHLCIQLRILWCPSWVSYVFAPVLSLELTPNKSDKGKALFKMFTTSTSSMKQKEIDELYVAAKFYDLCVEALPQLASDILIGLSSNGHLPSKLWYFLIQIARINTRSVLEALKTSQNYGLVSVIAIMCQTTLYTLSILDDHELYDEQQYFSLEDLSKLMVFLNSFIYSCIWEENMTISKIPVTHGCLSCLMLLLQRNRRKNFLMEEDLFIKDLRISKFMSEWKSCVPRALKLLQHAPHIIPHSKRVEIFYEYIKADKTELGIGSGHGRAPATYITINRNRILENGYEQLSSLSAVTIKGIIRVKFINEQGLDEAGIDEMGVFKEFLEEIIKKAFDPVLGIFKTNSDSCLYPSPTSGYHENHLEIFEFLGRILGKAVYEGIVLDLPFAVFFLHNMIKQTHSVLYSSLDELHSLDPELSKSLHFIKHYDGDMSDLCLTFSYEEEFLGKMVTHELIPGGSGIPVTLENKISYVHQLAHYKMTTQIKPQTTAFMKGFHAIIRPQWMSIFSAQEFQRVISGDDSDIDVDELRKHTQYYGGYHDKHRVIGWLWDILKNDFTLSERASFLKFVTSCSHPPLLGFGVLDPPFSIRRVDTADEEDSVNVTGVFRTLLGIKSGRRERLPTSSTCFNLLKLPDYNKKSLLKEKLIFAITSNAGFELS